MLPILHSLSQSVFISASKIATMRRHWILVLATQTNCYHLYIGQIFFFMCNDLQYVSVKGIISSYNGNWESMVYILTS